MNKFNVCMLLLLFSWTIVPAQQTSYSDFTRTLLDSVNTENLMRHIDSLTWAGGHQTRVDYTEGNYAASRYIARYLKSLPGIDHVQQDTFTLGVAIAPYNQYPVINVVAYMYGNGDDPDMVIAGGHYDASASHENNWEQSWSTLKAQGADDNATGIAAMLEMARILSHSAADLRNRRTIKFVAFGAEEYHPKHPTVHHGGSLWDAYQTDRQNKPLVGALILDMIAYNPSTNYIEVISDAQSLWMTDIVYAQRELFVPELSINETPVDVPYSDHLSYQEYGYPAILLMENDRPWNNDWPNYQSNPYYHSTADLKGTLNQQQLNLVTRLGLATLVVLSDPDTSATQISESLFAGVPDNFNVSAYPNPFNNQVRIRLDVPENQNVSIGIYNALGQKVAQLAEKQWLPSGTHTFRWDAARFSSGIYICRITGASQHQNLRLVLLR